MFDWFRKAIPKNIVWLVSENVASCKKRTSNIYTSILEFAFPKEDVID